MDNIVNSIPEFDPIRDLPDHFLMIMYGMRRSGKTVMLKHMLEQLQDRLQYHEVYLFCGTIDVNPDQYSFIPSSAQFSDVENLDYHLRKIVDGQKENKKKHRDRFNGKEPEKKKLFEKENESGSDSDSDPEPLLQQPKEVGTMSRHAAMKEIYDPRSQYEDAEYKPILIIMDDCVNENAVRNSSYLRLVAIGGRHIDISCIILR